MNCRLSFFSNLTVARFYIVTENEFSRFDIVYKHLIPALSRTFDQESAKTKFKSQIVDLATIYQFT